MPVEPPQGGRHPARGLRIRDAVRALIVTPDTDVLLVRFEFPARTVWSFPGGGLDPGEDHLTALHRELVEEVGLHGPTIGPHVWQREHLWPHLDGNFDGQRDRYYLVEVDARFTPRPSLTPEQLRAERLHEIRWWSLAEIERATADGVHFMPQRLAELLATLASDGVPTTPIVTGR